MKVLITGASGFIGRNLVEFLSTRHQVTAPASGDLNLIDLERLRHFLKSGHFDVVIHAATWNATRTSTKDLSLVLENNLRMFFNIENCRDYFGKLLNFGSGAEFAREHWMPMMKESYLGEHVPADQYGLSKYLIARYIESSRTAIYNLRLFGVYGKYEDWRIRFISQSCCRALAGIPITINQNVRFDYLLVDDLAQIVEWFIENDPPQRAYNVCTGQSCDLRKLAEMVLYYSTNKVEVRVVADTMGREYSGDNSRLLSALGPFQFSDKKESIGRLLSWYQDHSSLIEPSVLA